MEMPPSPLGPKDKENLMVLRKRLEIVTVSLVTNDDSHDDSNIINNQNQNSDVHVMMSYAWAANKPLVEAVTDILKKNGVDVWRDEVGSKKLCKMSGDIMEVYILYSYITHTNTNTNTNTHTNTNYR